MWIDFIIAAVLIIFIFRGDRRGLLASVLGIVGWAVSFIAAFRFYPSVVSLLEEHTNLKSNLTSRLISFAQDQILSQDSASQVPDSVASAMKSATGGAFYEQAAAAAEPVVNVIMGVIAVVLIMVVVKIVFKILIRLSQKLTGREHGVIGALNSIGGILFGLCEGLILAYLLLLLIRYTGLICDINALNDQITESISMTFLRTNNLIPYGSVVDTLSSL